MSFRSLETFIILFYFAVQQHAVHHQVSDLCNISLIRLPTKPSSSILLSPLLLFRLQLLSTSTTSKPHLHQYYLGKQPSRVDGSYDIQHIEHIDSSLPWYGLPLPTNAYFLEILCYDLDLLHVVSERFELPGISIDPSDRPFPYTIPCKGQLPRSFLLLSAHNNTTSSPVPSCLRNNTSFPNHFLPGWYPHLQRLPTLSLPYLRYPTCIHT